MQVIELLCYFVIVFKILGFLFKLKGRLISNLDKNYFDLGNYLTKSCNSNKSLDRCLVLVYMN